MAQVKISELPTLAQQLQSANYIPLIHNGITYKYAPFNYVVKNSGDETIAGVKEFSSRPTVGGKGVWHAGDVSGFSATPSAGKAMVWPENASGTFTPRVYGQTSAGLGEYSVASGMYTRIGNVCFIKLAVSWSAHTGTGNMLIDGLPFVSTSSHPYAKLNAHCNLLTVTGVELSALVVASSNIIRIYQVVSGGDGTQIALPSAGSVEITGFYFI